VRSEVFIPVFLAAAVVFFSCKKDVPAIPDPPLPQGDLAVSFTAKVNGLPLVPDTAWYINATEDTFTVSKFNYYISNVVLKSLDGKIFKEPESYHLIKHVKGNQSFTISGIPDGEYNSIEFMIGVDSLRNVSGAQTGALDPANDMFWEWSSGYIYYKLEGAYKSADIPTGQNYAMHIGGFAYPYSCIQTTSLNLPGTVVTKAGGHSRLSIAANVEEVFIRPKLISFDLYYKLIAYKQTPVDMSLNYKDMFKAELVEN
jgi:hypothetical protein